jgi:hypothetical protein
MEMAQIRRATLLGKPQVFMLQLAAEQQALTIAAIFPPAQSNMAPARAGKSNARRIRCSGQPLGVLPSQNPRHCFPKAA